MRRTKSYNEELSQRLRDPKYAQNFLNDLMENADGMSAEEALKTVIEIMGIKEFSRLTRVPSSNLVAYVKGRRKLKTETLDQLLKPFKMKSKVVFEKAG